MHTSMLSGVGDPVGVPVGLAVGLPVGEPVGLAVGEPVGLPVGEPVEHIPGDLAWVQDHPCVVRIGVSFANVDSDKRKAVKE